MKMTSLNFSDSQYLGEEFSLHDMIARSVKHRCTVSSTSLIGNDTEDLLKKQIPQEHAVFHMPEERLICKSQKIYSQSADTSTAKYLNSLQDVSEKLSNNEPKWLISHVCGSFKETAKQYEENVNDELMPLNFVAVPPLSVKNEPAEDYQNDVRCFNSNLKDPLGECSDALNFISGKNIKKECTSQNELQVKREPKDDDNVFGVHMTEDSFLSDIVTHSCHEFTTKESNPSDKLNKDEPKTCIPNVCVSLVKMTKQCEEMVNNELMPLTFVAVPLLSVKNEQAEEYQNDRKCFDSNLKDPLGECSGESNLMSGRNIKKGCCFQSELQVRSEPKEDNNVSGVQMGKEKVSHLCHELTTEESNPFVSCHEECGMENNASVMFGDSFCLEDHVTGETHNLEVKHESICEIPGVHLTLENFETNQSLNEGVCDDTVTLPFKPESSAQHFPVSGCQQNVNEEECDASTSEIATPFTLEIGNKTPDTCASRASSSVQSIFCKESKQIKNTTKGSDSSCQNDKIITSKKEIGFLPVVHVDPSHLQFKQQFRLRSEPVEIGHSHPSKIMNFSSNICSKSFTKMSYLRRHMPTLTRKSPFECDTCKKSFSPKRNLIVHIRTHTVDKPYKCEICKKSFSLKRYLFIHMRIHTDEKPYECEVCKKSFSRKKCLNFHMRTHTSDKPYECEICKKSFTRKDYLNVHVRTHRADKPYECKVCKKTIYGKNNLKEHMRLHTGEKPYECVTCKKFFSHKKTLNEHMRTHTDNRPHECEICKKSFSLKKCLIVHMHTHTDDKPYECEVCKKSFSRKDYFNIHVRTHRADTPYECKVCKKTIYGKNNLKEHMRLHTGEKPYECKTCKKAFSQKRYLNEHMLTHSINKPLACEICKKAFSLKKYLIPHMLTHSDDKPYECEICKNSFSQKNYLIVHMRTHTGERPFECVMCQKSFYRKAYLNSHMRTHTDHK